MKLRERQDQFIETLLMFDNWTDRFNFILEYGNLLDKECPPLLLPYRIERCQSRSYFLVDAGGGLLHVAGWSNAGVMGGLIACIVKIFEGVTLDDLRKTDIDFHTKTDLINNLTPLRREALTEIINRIKASDEPKRDRYSGEYR
jgi:cysteine desulfuration protein SufE